MFQVNPMQMVQMIKNGYNPQQLLLSVMQNQAPNNPMINNLLNLARNGQTSEIEQIARNLYSQNGRDFDTEFQRFKQQFGF